jgi:hypothetical protein
MKTTLDLPDDLMTAIKVRAAEENRRLKDVIAELLWRSLGTSPGALRRARKRVRLPLVRCAHRAAPEKEMTPERVARILVEGEVDREDASLR